MALVRQGLTRPIAIGATLGAVAITLACLVLGFLPSGRALPAARPDLPGGLPVNQRVIHRLSRHPDPIIHISGLQISSNSNKADWSVTIVQSPSVSS